MTVIRRLMKSSLLMCQHSNLVVLYELFGGFVLYGFHRAQSRRLSSHAKVLTIGVGLDDGFFQSVAGHFPYKQRRVDSDYEEIPIFLTVVAETVNKGFQDELCGNTVPLGPDLQVEEQ